MYSQRKPALNTLIFFKVIDPDRVRPAKWMVDAALWKDDKHDTAHTPETSTGRNGSPEIQLRAF